MEFKEHFEVCRVKVDEYLVQYWNSREGSNSPASEKLKQAIEYSALQKGAKRFRSVLTLLVADCFAGGPQKVLPFAAAIELIHTYSLIHDDLPCMDNDDLRRGQPTNHKVFGESTALLAGDALLTEAFLVVAQGYRKEPELGLKLVQLLSEAAGFSGMVGGQAIDLLSKGQKLSLSELENMHAMKTGALIRASVEGAAAVLGLSEDIRAGCVKFGALLGLAFQLKDDLLDSEGSVEQGSFPSVLGLQKTKEYLEDVTHQARGYLEQIKVYNGPLQEILSMNQERVM